MQSILEVPMICEKCGHRCPLGEAVPCADNSTRFGCPQPDCGGFMEAAD